MAHIPRLYSQSKLHADTVIEADQSDAHYLNHVLRCEAGDAVKVFNGNDGEWSGIIKDLKKKSVTITVKKQLRATETQSGFHVFCAPIKKDRYQTAIEKAVELGAESFTPLLTEYTDIPKVNHDRMVKQAIEATRQCEGLHVMRINPPVKLLEINNHIDDVDLVMVAAERGIAQPMQEVLSSPLKPRSGAILIGPEGGYSDDELTFLSRIEHIIPVHLGERVLRTETAVAASVTMWQNFCGTWNDYERKSS